MCRLRWPRHGRVQPLRLGPQRAGLPLGGGVPILPPLREVCIQAAEAQGAEAPAGGQGSARDSAAAAADAAAADAADADAAAEAEAEAEGEAEAEVAAAEYLRPASSATAASAAAVPAQTAMKPCCAYVLRRSSDQVRVRNFSLPGCL